MHFRGLCLGIDETFLLFQDKQNKQMLASKETKKPIHRSGRRATVLSSPQWNTPQNKLTYSWGKKVPGCAHWTTYPTTWSPSAPKCWFLAPVAGYWGSQCHWREFWRSDPQDRWSRQLRGSWLASPKFVTKLKLVLLTAWQANNW